ncbi:hypothetical protein EXIGLDRAFT_786975 [Exidia glandulosa HHB12029]|uniref:Endonuclease/exonuclease/phosphatase domain-containing protein n=1 Tax=Exidia glandulosa HHB12029 TaxID=1314781 RepID=A0A166AP81_EXIGL|nr:hypothetical protein EXIGLDRAFT_786975 [Exidia glandulosa HHB12029]
MLSLELGLPPVSLKWERLQRTICRRRRLLLCLPRGRVAGTRLKVVHEEEGVEPVEGETGTEEAASISPVCSQFVSDILVFTVPQVGVLSWNINGDLHQKMEDEDLMAILENFELIMLQETHLLPGEHDSLVIPPGYEVYSCPRPSPQNLSQQWGGVLALVHHLLEHSFRADISSPDVLVLDVAGICVINAYLPPQQSSAMAASDPNPVERFIAALTACSARPTVPVLVMLDANGRTADRQSTAWGPARTSLDTLLETRGREVIRIFGEHDLAILNGILNLFPSSGGWTSSQPAGTSVIDYMACGRALLDLIECFDVGPDVPKIPHELSTRITHDQAL